MNKNSLCVMRFSSVKACLLIFFSVTTDSFGTSLC